MKQIEKYIQFAIDNGYEEIDYIWHINWNNLWHADYDYKEIYWEFVEGDSEYYKAGFTSIIDIITSRRFIEAITRGVIKKANENNFIWSDWKWIFNFSEWVFIDVQYHIDNSTEWILLDELTTQQAIAIRDDKLTEFIETIFDNK